MTRYSTSAMILHWAIALLLVLNFGLGERTEHLRAGPELFAVFQLHKSVGILILFLSLWRLWIRIRRPRPPPLSGHGWLHRLAEFVHWGFYVIMIGGPLTGWILVSTAKLKLPTLLFGFIPWPHLPLGALGPALHEIAEEAHGLLARLLILLLFLHVAGAIRHQLLLKEPLLERMMPRKQAGVVSLAIALALLGSSFWYGRYGPLGGGEAVAAPAPSADVKSDAPSDPQTSSAPAQAVKAGELKAAPKTPAPVEKTKGVTEPAPAAAKDTSNVVPEWQATPGGQLGFTVVVNGEQVKGQFTRWTSAIKFDPAQLEKSSISAEIDLGSVASGDAQRDQMLADSDFFAIAAHPRARFQSREIKAKGGNRYTASGPLTIKGISRPITLNFTLDIEGDRASAKADTTLNRGAFGIGSGQFSGDETISSAVQISISLSAKKEP